MTRKDYVALAAAFYTAYEGTTPAERQGIDFALHQVAIVLATDNPNFDQDRFCDEAGYEVRPAAEQPAMFEVVGTLVVTA